MRNIFLAIICSCLFLQLKAQPGALDLSFDIGTGADNNIRAIAVQPDGKILVGGDFFNFNGTPANLLTRLNPDGSTDTSFLFNAFNYQFRDFENRLYKILVQPDNKILIAGDYGFIDGNNDTLYYLMRLLPNGLRDTTFKQPDFFGGLKNVILQPDGKLIIGGNHTTINNLPYGHLTRLHSNGDIDTTFNTLNGLNGSVETISLQPDGKVLLAGSFTSFFGVQGFRLARANTDGSPDVTLNPGIGGAGSNIYTSQLLPNGKIMLGGEFTFYNGSTVGYVVRTRANGTIDFTFRQNPGANLPVYALKLLEDSSFFAGGSFTQYYNIPRNRLAKITADGYVDTVFNPGSGADDDILAITLQNDDKVLVGGRFTSFDGVARNRIARLYNCLSPQPDTILGLPYAECRGTLQTYTITPIPGATKYEWTLPSGWTGSSDSTSITVVSDGSGGTISVKAFTPQCGFSYATTLTIATLQPPGIDICLVTVDTASTHNIIIWEKQPTSLIDSFCIYRETTSNIYTKIATIPFDSLSEYHDYDANPNTTSYRYKMSIIDTCGAESALSPFHNTIHLQNLGNGNFQWTFYQIEGQPNPVISFNMNRDAFANGDFFPIGNIPGTNATFSDISYSSFPDAEYVVDVNWGISCSPVRATVNTTRSNIRKPNALITSEPSDNLLNASSVMLYPNPASSVLKAEVYLPDLKEPVSLKITNILGETITHEVLEKEAGKYAKPINVSPYAKGVYILTIEAGKAGTVQKRFIVQ